jgi:hypothetical protein
LLSQLATFVWKAKGLGVVAWLVTADQTLCEKSCEKQDVWRLPVACRLPGLMNFDGFNF